MPNVVCPRCQQTVHVPDNLERPHCVRCGEAINNVDTQFTAAPSMLTPQAIQPIDQFERSGDELRDFTDWDEFRATSPAVQQELLELARRPMPDLRNVYLKPLPPEMPAETEGWKRPLGTIEGDGDRIVPIFHGLATLFFGLVGALACGGIVLRVAEAGDRLSKFVSIVGFGGALAVVAFALWLLIGRSRKLPYKLWVFEEGLFWLRGGRFRGFATWKDVRRFQSDINPVTRMPIFWLTVPGNIRFDIEADRAPAMIPLLEFIEIRLTASQLLPRLQQIYEGKCVGFGAVQLDRHGLTCAKFLVPWSQIDRVVRDRDNLFMQVRGRESWVPIPYAAVSFPLVVMAIAHILIAEEEKNEPEA